MAKINCPICNDLVKLPDDGICPSCGISMSAALTHQASASVVSPPVAKGEEECPVCSATVKPGSTICDDCGINLAEAQAMMGGSAHQAPAPATAQTASTTSTTSTPTCFNCGKPRRKGAKFCRNCGEPFTIEIQQAEELLKPNEYLRGRYRIVRKLGGGGMGAVYLAQDMNLKGKEVAIKAVLNSNDPDLLRAARQEAENLLGIDHPNIVTLRDIVEKGNIPLIVMDYLEGPDWSDHFEQQVSTHNEFFTAEEALKMILGILPAFEYLHYRRPPVVYRDFKPGQVKIVTVQATGEERHVLLDLGVAYTYEGKPEEAWGTPGYAPPEVGGVCLQPPSMDLACICRTLQGLLGIDLSQYGYGEMPKMQDVPWIPEELYYLLERGTAKERGHRFQLIADLRAQLEGVQRLIQGREGTLPRPSGIYYAPVMSQLFTGNLHRTTGQLISLPLPNEDDPAAQLLDRTNDLLLQKKTEEALQQVEEALRVNPRSTNALLLKTVALAQKGDFEGAQKQLGQVEKLTDISSDWSYIMVAAQIAEEVNELDKAEQLYRNLIRLVPGELPPRQKLANLLLKNKRHSEAATLYAQIVGADPANAEGILNWADALAATGQIDQSIKVLRRVGENAVRFVDAQIRMIELLLLRASRTPSTLNLAAEALQSLQGRAQTPRYYRLTGDWWFEAYQLDRQEAVKHLNTWPLVNEAQDKKQMANHARQAYRHYLRVAPQNPDVDEIIGRIHFGIKELM